MTDYNINKCLKNINSLLLNRGVSHWIRGTSFKLYSMLAYLKNLWAEYKKKQELKKCTQCGEKFYRTEWGARQHISRNGSISIHPIDYLVAMNYKTFAEKREAIAKMEEVDRMVRKIKIENGDKFCKDHYRGCPE